MMKVKFYFLLSAFVYLLSGWINAQSKLINASDFGAVPSDGKNDRPALQEAVDACRKAPGSTLVIEPGMYDIVAKEECRISNVE